ncbi:non-contractile tail fiber protein [Pseudomonas phage phiPstEGF]|nr:non-contractile tail fiber protein [Pseudomonas phage phiPst2111]WPH61396.1 non-contractile tail fiber protein [Pseudomonas phage phiPstEGF]WPK27858.1 non-contractile tail fiber protein [Pseudomonas phage phiPstE]
MATTPKTVRTYALDGTKKDFTIPFEYLARKFVVVTLIGATRRELILNTEYRFTTNTTITTTKAWGPADNFDLIEIRRLTSATERLVDFADGSILRAYDLNISQVQSLHIAEEARDLTADTIGVNNDGDLDARARKIVNLADGVNDGDAVNLRQQKQWAGSALNQAQAAAASAQAAATNNAQSLVNNQQSYQNLVAAQQQAANSANSASASQTSRLASEAARDASAAARDLSQAWSSKAEDQVVASGLYSSYHYSRKSAASATASQTSATNSANSASFSTTEANRATTQADRAKTEADKLGNFNGLAGALNSVVGTTVTWKGDQVSLSGKYISRSDGEANFSFAKADGSDLIRFVRTADRTVHLFGDAGGDGDRMTWSQTGVTIPKALTVNGFTTLAGAQVNGSISMTGSLLAAGNVRANGGNLQVFAAASNANSHVWFYNSDGATRGIIYGGTDNVMRLQAGTASVAQQWDTAGNSTITGNLNVVQGISATRGTMQSTFYEGSGISSGSYGQCQLQLQGTGGGVAKLGFHNAGRVALTLWLTDNNELQIMKNSGVNTEIIHNGNLGAWNVSAMSAEVIGQLSFLQNVSGSNLDSNSQLAGGNLRKSTHNNVSGAPGGTWRSMGWSNNGGVSIWQRVA